MQPYGTTQFKGSKGLKTGPEAGLGFYSPVEHYSLDAEAALLGALMLEKHVYHAIYSLRLSPEHFYSPIHAAIFAAIQEMGGRDLDVITVTAAMVRMGNGMVEGKSAAYHTCNVQMAVTSTAHVAAHALIVKQYYLARVGFYGAKMAGAPGQDALDVAQQVNELMQKALSTNTEDDWMDASQVMLSLMQHREKVKGKDLLGISTGFRSLDRLTAGFQPGQVIFLGARPSVGKTAFAGSIALHAAQHSGKAVGIVSLEMPEEQMGARLASLYSGEEFNTIYRNRHREEKDEVRMAQHLSNMGSLPFYLSTKTNVSGTDIRYKTERLKRRIGDQDLGLLVIDYLQLLEGEPGNKNGTRENEISKLSRDIKKMAMDLAVPVLLLGQLNRESTKSVDKRPNMSQIRESGALEQDADIVMLLHRPWKSGILTNEAGESNEFEAEIILEKNRNGQTATIPIEFDGASMRFFEPDGSNAFDKPMPNPQQRETPAAAYTPSKPEYLQQPENPYAGFGKGPIKNIMEDDQPF